MNSSQIFWWRLLVAATAGLMLFGLILVVMPGFTLQSFSLLVYASTAHLNTFGPEAMAYISLVHAVLGSVMFGWGVVLMFLALGPVRRGSKDAWRMFVVSLVAWFIPDTAYSLLSGFWQNAVLNAGFALMFAIPLTILRSFTTHERA
ncbi:MAG: hypothetical protein A3I66_04945 [Burkholderiales bacterium RIFCSPLOWO2_02_FULL_57_36]|nr:MAG: hypothetical protein A3I66_04945 [Burkholderiales bacterium RIFCSPLOWO2_02_FULL_57_36]